MPSRKSFLLSIIRRLGEFQMQHFEKEIEFQTKSGAMDLVSFVDTQSQKMFTDELAKLFPEDVVFGEEGYDPKRDYPKEPHCWVIDPVDGTLLFKRGIPLFGVMIAYVESSDIKLSAIYLPAIHELYFADETGTRKNDEKLHVSTTNTLSTSVLNLCSYSLPNAFPDGKGYFDFLKKIGSCVDVYAAAYAMTACASGKMDGGVFYPNYGNVWDTVPGGFLIQQAGGKVTTIGQDTWDIWNRNMIYSNGLIHKELQEALKVV